MDKRNIEFRSSSHVDSDALLRRIHALEIELEETQKSFSYRLGQLIRETVFSPLKHGPKFPIQLARLLREYYNKSDYTRNASITNEYIHGRKIRNRRQYSQPGKVEYQFVLFNEFKTIRKTRNSNLRIACILSPWMHSCLDFEAMLIPICMVDWQEVLKKNKPDFLLVQSLFEKTEFQDGYLAAQENYLHELEELISYCKRKNIPTVFWDTEDHVHLPLFLKIASLFEQVFAADPKSVEKYSRKLNREVIPLPPAVQPALHNPLKPENYRYKDFTILFDGWADILEQPEAFQFLKPLFKSGLHIIESRYRLRANKLDDLPEFRENIMGCISYKNLLSALRHYRVLIMPNKSLSSPLARTWRAMEALACGCNVVMNEAKETIIPNLIIQVKDNISLIETANHLLSDGSYRLKLSHLARRKIYNNHTYAHRLKTICEFLKIKHGWEQFPKVSFVAPTKRPELIRSCLEKFKSQNYPNKELIIVVNTTEANMEDISDMISKCTDIRVFLMHQEKNIGTCLNYGIAQANGKYWFKMDDDDLYGPNYLLDMVHLTGTADFHILGKPKGFIYIENKDKVYLRNGAIASQHVIGSIRAPDLTGATLGGRKDLFPGFSENHRSCVDTGFTDNSKAMGYTIMSGDIWNFIAFRAKDKQKHTWRHDDKGLIRNAAFFSKGEEKNIIMI